ncbi:hypothetical protein V3468_06045 [Flavobacterium oreochromis]|uniref:hypothetical protein n=1 Tax=Flavobacterium oreochromis TaxID=2906078 RepID=UPI00385BCB7D
MSSDNKINSTIVILFLLFVIYITKKIAVKLNDKGCISNTFTFLIVLAIFSIFLSGTIIWSKSLYKYSLGKKYIATIVSYSSYEEDYTDSEKRRRKRTFYIPTLKIIDKNHNVIQLESATHRSSVPVIGSKVDVVYIENDSTFLENNGSTYFLTFIGFIFSVIFGFLSYVIILYAFNLNELLYKISFLRRFF